MDHKDFVLTAPIKVKVQKLVNAASGIVKETDRHHDGRQTFLWESKNVKALPSESQLPPEWIGAASVSYFSWRCLRLFCGTAPDDVGSFVKKHAGRASGASACWSGQNPRRRR